jgi:AcrR family transcriptional regulator
MDVNGESLKVVQGEATREALLGAARNLFGARGYAETSLDAIAATAGVTKGALYHHFAGKEELFQLVFEQVKRDLSSRLRLVLRDPDPWKRLVSACRTYIELHTDPAVQRIVLRDARAVLSHEAWRRVDSQWGAVMFRGAFRQAIHHGIIVELPLNTLAMVVTGALAEACLVVANAEDPASARAEALSVIEQLLLGLRRAGDGGSTTSEAPTLPAAESS